MQVSTGKTALARRARGALPEQILDTPRPAEVVLRLPPETLPAAIEQSGLEACGALLVLATPAQVARVLDLDLWRRPEAGHEERFDADRFGLWLDVLVEQGVEVAAAMLARLDVDLVAAGFAQHVRIFDIATLEAYETTDGTAVPAVIERDGGLGCDLAGRRLIPRRTDAWDAITGILAELAASHLEAFVRLMRACSALSNSRREVDGLDDLRSGADQAMFDLADARQQRREALGYAAPDSARAFLDASRRLRLDAAGRPPGSTIPRPPAVPPASAPATGIATSHGAAASMFHAMMQQVAARDPMAAGARQEEIGWLANALLAGCSIDGRAFTPQEAAGAVVATCNLGLEYWPGAWRGGPALADDFLVGQDLVTVFQVGWTTLHDDVSAHAASRLLDALADLPRHDPETEADLAALRATLRRHWRAGTPWQARDALDVLATLDLPARATLLGLIAECPVALGTIQTAGAPAARRVDPSAFVFISERAQIAAVDAFLAGLPQAFRG